jgi:hypothetical protein
MKKFEIPVQPNFNPFSMNKVLSPQYIEAKKISRQKTRNKLFPRKIPTAAFGLNMASRDFGKGKKGGK